MGPSSHLPSVSPSAGSLGGGGRAQVKSASDMRTWHRAGTLILSFLLNAAQQGWKLSPRRRQGDSDSPGSC